MSSALVAPLLLGLISGGSFHPAAEPAVLSAPHGAAAGFSHGGAARFWQDGINGGGPASKPNLTGVQRSPLSLALLLYAAPGARLRAGRTRRRVPSAFAPPSRDRPFASDCGSCDNCGPYPRQFRGTTYRRRWRA
jgi:hypothetical protein